MKDVKLTAYITAIEHRNGFKFDTSEKQTDWFVGDVLL